MASSIGNLGDAARPCPDCFVNSLAADDSHPRCFDCAGHGPIDIPRHRCEICRTWDPFRFRDATAAYADDSQAKLDAVLQCSREERRNAARRALEPEMDPPPADLTPSGVITPQLLQSVLIQLSQSHPTVVGSFMAPVASIGSEPSMSSSTERIECPMDTSAQSLKKKKTSRRSSSSKKAAASVGDLLPPPGFPARPSGVPQGGSFSPTPKGLLLRKRSPVHPATLVECADGTLALGSFYSGDMSSQVLPPPL